MTPVLSNIWLDLCYSQTLFIWTPDSCYSQTSFIWKYKLWKFQDPFADPEIFQIYESNSCCCERKSGPVCAQSFALWQQATKEFTCPDHSIIACSRQIYAWCCSSRTSRLWWITHLMQHHRRGCNTVQTQAVNPTEIYQSYWLTNVHADFS